MKKRTVIISVTVVLLLAVGVTAFAFWKRHRVDLKVLKVRELQAKLRDPNLTPEQLALQFQEMRKAMEQLAPEQRMQMMRSRRNPAATYFALPPDQRAEFLNQQIEEQEKRRQAWEDARASRGSAGPGERGRRAKPPARQQPVRRCRAGAAQLSQADARYEHARGARPDADLHRGLEQPACPAGAASAPRRRLLLSSDDASPVLHPSFPSAFRNRYDCCLPKAPRGRSAVFWLRDSAWQAISPPWRAFPRESPRKCRNSHRRPVELTLGCPWRRTPAEASYGRRGSPRETREIDSPFWPSAVCVERQGYPGTHAPGSLAICRVRREIRDLKEGLRPCDRSVAS